MVILGTVISLYDVLRNGLAFYLNKNDIDSIVLANNNTYFSSIIFAIIVIVTGSILVYVLFRAIR